MRRRSKAFLVAWDKPGTRSAPGRFYREMKERLGGEVEFIQRSVYGARTLESAQKLAKLAGRYRLRAVIFRAKEIRRVSS